MWVYNPYPFPSLQLWNCLIHMIKTILFSLLTGFILESSLRKYFKVEACDSRHILCVLPRQTRHFQNNKYETKLPYNWTQTKTYWTKHLYIYQTQNCEDPGRSWADGQGHKYKRENLLQHIYTNSQRGNKGGGLPIIIFLSYKDISFTNGFYFQ